jgi:hypothetical protein
MKTHQGCNTLLAEDKLLLSGLEDCNQSANATTFDLKMEKICGISQESGSFALRG